MTPTPYIPWLVLGALLTQSGAAVAGVSTPSAPLHERFVTVAEVAQPEAPQADEPSEREPSQSVEGAGDSVDWRARFAQQDTIASLILTGGGIAIGIVGAAGYRETKTLLYEDFYSDEVLPLRLLARSVYYDYHLRYTRTANVGLGLGLLGAGLTTYNLLKTPVVTSSAAQFQFFCNLNSAGLRVTF